MGAPRKNGGDGGGHATGAGTAQALIGQYGPTALSWSSPASAAWHETPAQVNALCTGKPVRIECSTNIGSTPGAVIDVGLGVNGGVLWVIARYSLGSGAANMPVSGTVYYTPSAGTHRFAIFAQPNTGTVGIDGIGHTMLYVTEQRC